MIWLESKLISIGVRLKGLDYFNLESKKWKGSEMLGVT